MQTAEPLISVCTPIYNTEKYLEECLESLFNAKMADQCEFIFVNDCATDSSPRILQEVSEKYKNLNIKIINHEKNRGVAAARNTALSHATGKYIIHLDSDDSVKVNFFEKLYNSAVENDADLVISENWEKIDGNTLTSAEKVRLLIDHHFPITLWCKLAKRSVFTDNSIKWTEGVNVGEDPIVSVKIVYHSKKTVFLMDNLYNYREFVGFVMKVKHRSFFYQKQQEFVEIRDFAIQNGFYDYIKDLIELRFAEIKYESLKNENPLSFRKYEFMKEQNLGILCEKRPDFNKKSARLLIRLVDGRMYFPANCLYASYRIISKIRNLKNFRKNKEPWKYPF